MKTAAVREHFRRQVQDYPDLMRRIIPFYDEQREVICRLIPFESHRAFRVLDLGCGPGLSARRILAEYSHAKLTALDVIDDMVEACRARLGATDRRSRLVSPRIAAAHMASTTANKPMKPTIASVGFASLSRSQLIARSLDGRRRNYAEDSASYSTRSLIKASSDDMRENDG